jgi:cell wall-associated NlpC family hydrolase
VALPFLEKGFIKIGIEKYPYKGKSQQLEKKYTYKHLLNIAQTYLGIPYLWGGKTNQGIDCSGFTQMVFKQNGFNLPRDSYQQAEVGKKVTLKEAQPGDVAFFQRKIEGEGKVVHVGIYLGEGKIIHADGKVRINALDETGIYRDDLGKHSHFLKFLRRME